MKRATFLAWCVHFYTATGLIIAALMAVLIVRGGDEAFRTAFLLMLVATFIDSTDGWLARRARVKQVVPSFDGSTLDNLIDFQTYTSLPLLLVWRAGLLPGAYAWWLLLPLLASGYGFSQTKAKTDDGFFLGFPSYWNVVAFYLYYLQPPVPVSLALIISLSVLTFIPARYLYPSQRAPFNRLTIVLASLWGVLVLLLILRRNENERLLTLVSLVFPIYYLLMSWALTIRRRG
ncbi:MAG TPA: CDP-alcohol phosphatidyltransferase family protein [Pyrinomonadaceae bacterium]|jgi:phosphatidylcholine synthase|nr:CDP-alcohol phosphatidyltransferase family protein [Pyrinomonadaceae bacterium]